jgi:hypothetical protein
VKSYYTLHDCFTYGGVTFIPHPDSVPEKVRAAVHSLSYFVRGAFLVKPQYVGAIEALAAAEKPQPSEIERLAREVVAKYLSIYRWRVESPQAKGLKAAIKTLAAAVEKEKP